MHGHHPARIEIEKGAGSVGGIGVDVAECRRIVGADRKQRQFRGEPLADFAEAREVSRVAGVVNGMFSAAQDIATVAAMGILDDACSPMSRGNVGDRQIRDGDSCSTNRVLLRRSKPRSETKSKTW